MSHIIKFDNYSINEKLGIAESTLYYVDVCRDRCWDFLALTLGDSDVKDGEKYITNIVIPFQEFKRKVTDWNMFSYFPVSQILLDITIEKKPKDKVMSTRIDSTSRYEVPYKISAYASTFAKGRERAATRITDPIRMNLDHSLSLHLGLDLEYSDNFDLNRHSTRLKLEIESTILHELNHLYEHYFRKMNGHKNMNLALTWASVADNDYRRKKELYIYWYRNFTHLIYLSEKHEVSAWIHESKPYVDKLDFRSFQRTNLWKTADHMKNWDYEKFIKDFNKYTKQINSDYYDIYIDVLIKDFIKTYEKLTVSYEEIPIIKIETLRSMSRDDFFKFFQKKINKSGDKMIRGMSRLYSLKADDQSNITNF